MCFIKIPVLIFTTLLFFSQCREADNATHPNNQHTLSQLEISDRQIKDRYEDGYWNQNVPANFKF
jgi:hypothetical protein